jgi:hypothetical protein
MITDPDIRTGDSAGKSNFSRVVVPGRAQSCRQTTNVVFLRLGFLQVHYCDSGGQFLRLVCFRFSHQPLVFKAEAFLRQQLKRLENRTHRADSRLTMKSQLIAIVAAVLVVGCGRYGVVCSDQIGCRALAQARHFGGLFFEQKKFQKPDTIVMISA